MLSSQCLWRFNDCAVKLQPFVHRLSDINEIWCVCSGHRKGLLQWVSSWLLIRILSYEQICHRPRPLASINMALQILVCTCPQSMHTKFDEILTNGFWGTHLWHFWRPLWVLRKMLLQTSSGTRPEAIYQISWQLDKQSWSYGQFPAKPRLYA